MNPASASLLIYNAELDQVEPQVRDAKQCDRPVDDTVCTLTAYRLVLFWRIQMPGRLLPVGDDGTNDEYNKKTKQ